MRNQRENATLFIADVILVKAIIGNMQHEYLETICLLFGWGLLEGKNGTCPQAGVAYYAVPGLNLSG